MDLLKSGWSLVGDFVWRMGCVANNTQRVLAEKLISFRLRKTIESLCVRCRNDNAAAAAAARHHYHHQMTAVLVAHRDGHFRDIKPVNLQTLAYRTMRAAQLQPTRFDSRLPLPTIITLREQ